MILNRKPSNKNKQVIQMTDTQIYKILNNNKLIFLMLMLYVFTQLKAPQIGRSALYIAKDNILQLVMVMPIILALTSLIKAWVPEDLISKNLGRKSGVKGTLMAFVLGSVSAGPIYAAFPFAKVLLDKGASVRNITILLSSWAVIKVPMLANELAFLGPEYMITRWCLTVCLIFVLSVITEKLVSKEDILLDIQNREEQETFVSSSDHTISPSCTGCSVCLKALPADYDHLIIIENKQARFKANTDFPKSILDTLNTVCPRKAIL